MKSYSAMLWLTVAAECEKSASKRLGVIENKLLANNKDVLSVATIEMEELSADVSSDASE